MNNEAIIKKSKKWWCWLLVIALIIIAAIAGYSYGRISSSTGATKVTPNVVIQDFGNLPPDIFPTDFPFEVGTLLTESTKTTFKEPGGTIQARVVYISKKTMQENATKFLNYLNEKGWTIINNTNNGGIYSLYAQKDRKAIICVMKYDEAGGGLMVEVNYLIIK